MQTAISRGFTLYKLTARETGAFFGGGGGEEGWVRSGGFWGAKATADKRAKRLVDFQ